MKCDTSAQPILTILQAQQQVMLMQMPCSLQKSLKVFKYQSRTRLSSKDHFLQLSCVVCQIEETHTHKQALAVTTGISAEIT